MWPSTGRWRGLRGGIRATLIRCRGAQLEADARSVSDVGRAGMESLEEDEMLPQARMGGMLAARVTDASGGHGC